jgi:hypothetical protein
MSTNYRAFNTKLVTSGSAALVDRAWGVLPVSGVTGTITLEGFGTGSTIHPTIALEHLTSGQPFPCYVRNVTVTNGGSVYVLA